MTLLVGGMSVALSREGMSDSLSVHACMHAGNHTQQATSWSFGYTTTEALPPTLRILP
jgi:hypothetical protein